MDYRIVIDLEDSRVLYEALLRYLKTTDHPDEDIMLAILGIEREAEE